MEAYQERVIAEKRELDERRGKLVAFLATDVFERLPAEERHLLQCQEAAMHHYSWILSCRIMCNFRKEFAHAECLERMDEPAEPSGGGAA